MINNFNKIKSLLSKLKVANRCNKKIVRIKKTNMSKIILDLLWKKGFIYGYGLVLESNCYYIVFLKYSEENNGMLTNLFFFKTPARARNISKLEKNSVYFFLNEKGYFFDSITKDKKGCILIARV